MNDLRERIAHLIFVNTPTQVSEDELTDKIMHEIGNCGECKHYNAFNQSCILNDRVKVQLPNDFCSDFKRREK